MSNELTIPPVRTTATTTDAPKAPPTKPARVEPPAAAAKPHVNPSLRLDAELGLVVIEFRNDDGALTATIPSERQIQAYRVHQEPRQREITREAPAEAQAEPPKEASREIPREPRKDAPREPRGESTDRPHRTTRETRPRPESAHAEAPERHDVPRAEAREARPPPPKPESRPA